MTGSGSQHFCSFPVLQTHNNNLKGLTLRLCFVSLSHCNIPPPPTHPTPPRPLLPTSFGEVSRPKNTTTPPANCTTEVTRKAYCTQKHTALCHLSPAHREIKWHGGAGGGGSDLVAVLQHHGSQEGTEDVTHRGAGAPQAEHEAAPEKQGRARVLILKIKFIKTNKNNSLHLF